MILNPTVDSHAKAQGRRARNDSGTVSILVVKGSPIKQVRVTEFPRKHPETPRTLPRAEARADQRSAELELRLDRRMAESELRVAGRLDEPRARDQS